MALYNLRLNTIVDKPNTELSRSYFVHCHKVSDHPYWIEVTLFERCMLKHHPSNKNGHADIPMFHLSLLLYTQAGVYGAPHAAATLTYWAYI